MLRRLRRLITPRYFLKARSGAAAVEFALIAPVLILIYWGLADLSLGMMASRKTAHLASTMGDLVAQSESVSPANLSDIFDIGASILEPFPTVGKLHIQISCVTRNKANDTMTIVSKQRNWDGGTFSTAGITTDQLPRGESMIVTQVRYDFTPPVGEFLPAKMTFSNIAYHHPRSGGTVTFTN